MSPLVPVADGPVNREQLTEKGVDLGRFFRGREERRNVNAHAIAEAARSGVQHESTCLRCGHVDRSATPAGLAILVDHHARTQHGGQR